MVKTRRSVIDLADLAVGAAAAGVLDCELYIRERAGRALLHCFSRPGEGGI